MLEVMIFRYAEAGADCVMFGEDLGTQTQTLISPALWQKEFHPWYQRLCNAAHRCWIRVFMHSCGAISAIIPGLIHAGIDLLQFDQPELHGIEKLASFQKQERITFWCGVDIQKTLLSVDEVLIRKAAVQMLDLLWRGHGGFVAGFYGDEKSINLDPKWQQIASETFRIHGIRERYLPEKT
jgi:hypothetical protein